MASLSVRKTTSTQPQDTKSIITIIALLLIYPVGLLLAWFWTKWTLWVKILLSIPAVLSVLGIFFLTSFLLRVNPKEIMQRAHRNDDQIRRTHIREIATAIREYYNDNGQFPVGITNEEKYISSSYVNICADLVPKYLPTLPVDPTPVYDEIRNIKDCSGFYETGYMVHINEEGFVVVNARSDTGTILTDSK